MLTSPMSFEEIGCLHYMHEDKSLVNEEKLSRSPAYTPEMVKNYKIYPAQNRNTIRRLILYNSSLIRDIVMRFYVL